MAVIHPKLGPTEPRATGVTPPRPFGGSTRDDFGRSIYGPEDGLHVVAPPSDATLAAGRPYPNPEGRGLIVKMQRIKGLTDPRVLKVPFVFQCPPLDSFEVQHTYDHTDYQTIGHGGLSRPVGHALSTVTFNSLFVPYDAPWTQVRARQWNGGLWVPNPVQLTQELHTIMDTGTPFELIAGQPKLWGDGGNNLHWGPVNKNAATLRTLTVNEKAGEPDARYVGVQFTEYRSVKLLRAGKGKRNERDLPARVSVDLHDDVRLDGKVILKKGTLHALARYFYGTTAPWRRIAKENGITNFAPSRGLGDWVKHRKEKTLALRIPVVVTGPGLPAFGEGPGIAGDASIGIDTNLVV